MTHRLERPEWFCSCGQHWPCQCRREQLLDEYSGSLKTLRIMMDAFLADALADQPDRSGADMRRQLTGWLPPRGVAGGDFHAR